MATSSANNEIQELIDMFYYYIEHYENCMTQEYPTDIIKNSFEAANLIEKTVTDLNNKSLWSQFLSCLNSWLYSKNRTLVYDEKFYSIACDHLLLKHFYIDKNVETAIKLYTSYCPKERFQKCIENAIMIKSKTDLLLAYNATTNDSNLDKTEFQCKLLLFKWATEIGRANRSTVEEHIIKMLDYTVDKQLLYLIEILSFENLESEEIQVQNIILKELLKQMNDRSKLSENFWYALIKIVDKKIIAKACMLFNDFLNSLIDFLVYFSCMMDYHINNRKRIWKSNSNIICPDITFEDIVLLFQTLINYNEYLLKYIKTRIESAKTTSETLIWNDIIKLCF